MEPGLNDFLSQIPIGFIIAPIFFGILYIAMMAVIFRRAAERRRKRKEVQMGQIDGGGTYPQAQLAPRFAPAMAGAAVSAAAAPTILSSRTALMTTTPPVEEPDLDMLTSNSLLDEAERMSTSAASSADSSLAAAPVSVGTPIASTPDAKPKILSTEEDPDDAVEVMRIWRDVNDGGLIVQMGNQRYRTLLEVRTPELQRRFTAVVRDLMGIAGISGGSTTNTGSSAPATPRTTGTFAPAASSAAPPTAARPSGVLDRVVRRGSTPKPAEDQPAGIAASVEEFLQLRLIGTPHFASRNIHVRPSIDQGIRIEVDGQFYDSVDEVADAEVRDFLQTVMAEWASRQ